MFRGPAPLKYLVFVRFEAPGMFFFRAPLAVTHTAAAYPVEWPVYGIL